MSDNIKGSADEPARDQEEDWDPCGRGGGGGRRVGLGGGADFAEVDGADMRSS